MPANADHLCILLFGNPLKAAWRASCYSYILSKIPAFCEWTSTYMPTEHNIYNMQNKHRRRINMFTGKHFRMKPRVL